MTDHTDAQPAPRDDAMKLTAAIERLKSATPAKAPWTVADFCDCPENAPSIDTDIADILNAVVAGQLVLADQPARAGMVKPLVWDENRYAEDPWGGYWITDRPYLDQNNVQAGEIDAFGWAHSSRGDFDDSEDDVWPTVEEAKAGAQADLEKRIAALLPTEAGAEPREFWLETGRVFNSYDQAIQYAGTTRDPVEIIHVREVVASPQPAATTDNKFTDIAEDVAEQIKEGSGFWATCSGCHESNEGVPTGSYSSVFQCHLGDGCRECGGIGALWDNIDYSDFGKEEVTAVPQSLELLRRLIKWDKDFPVNCSNGYAGLKELDKIIAEAAALSSREAKTLRHDSPAASLVRDQFHPEAEADDAS